MAGLRISRNSRSLTLNDSTLVASGTGGAQGGTGGCKRFNASAEAARARRARLCCSAFTPSTRPHCSRSAGTQRTKDVGMHPTDRDAGALMPCPVSNRAANVARSTVLCCAASAPKTTAGRESRPRATSAWRPVRGAESCVLMENNSSIVRRRYTYSVDLRLTLQDVRVFAVAESSIWQSMWFFCRAFLP